MAILKRENKYLGLKDISVLVDERAAESRYFKISDFPSVIPQGKSSFLIAGSKFLKTEVELKIEILDSQGKTIYTEPVPNLLEGNARRVSIEVYDDTAPGNGFMYIVGELKSNYKGISDIDANQDDITGQVPVPGGQIPVDLPFGGGAAESNPFAVDGLLTGDSTDRDDVPEEFENVYNVRFVKPIFVNTVIPNSEPIFFYQEPRLTVTEIVKPYLEQTDEIGTVTLSGSFTVNPAPNLPPPPPDVTPSDPGFPTINTANITKIGKGLKKFKKKRKNKINPFQNQSFMKRGRKVRRSSPEIDTFTITVDKLESSVENDADLTTSAHVGATLTINNPQVDTSEFPANEFTIPSVYSTTIAAVNNNKTLVPEDDFLITKTDTGESIPAGITLTAESSTTMSFDPLPTASLSNTHNRSFAKVIAANLRTFSGDVFKTRIYGKSQGSLGDFEVVYDGPIESPQALIDQNSATGLTSAGYFYEMDVVRNNWKSGSQAGEAIGNPNTTSVTRNDEKILDGILISGSNYAQSDYATFTTTYAYELQENVPYTLEFDAYFYKESGVNSDGDVVSDFDCEIQLSKSARVIGESVNVFETLGRINIDNYDQANEGEILGNHVTFVTPSGGDVTGKIRFKINQGRLILGDVILRPYSETNFSPDFFEVYIPMPDPLPKKPDFYDFLVEFYDINNNLAESIISTEQVEFDGAPANIDGDDNLISGSVFLGNAAGGGIELYGGSSFIRSIGYAGFDNVIASGSGGFVLFSGSIQARLSSSEAYEGVGFEMVDAHGSVDRYIKFRSNPSTFQVVTDEFFLGTPRTVSPAQFISGSDAKIEISSSNFHLQPDGKLIVGDKANDKYIEWDNSDLTVRGDISVDSIKTPATIGGTTSTFANASSSIDSIGFAKFASASIAGWEITPDAIQDVNSSGKGIVLTSNPSTPFIDVKEDDNNKIRLYHTAGDNWGLIGTSGGNTVFRLGNSNQIAGWTINNDTIQGGNLILGKSGLIKSSDYVSDFSGFIITAEENGYAEFENVKIRGTLATTTFEKESVNAVGGQLFIANSAAMTGSTTPATGSSFSLKNVTGFTKGEILLIKKVTDTGFNTEYVQVVSSSRTNAGGDDDPDGLAGNLFIKRGIGYYNRVSASNSSKFGEGNGGLEFVGVSASSGVYRTLDTTDTTGLAYVGVGQSYISGDLNGFTMSSGHTHSGSFHVYITGSIGTVGDGTAVDFKLLNNSNSDSVIGSVRLWSLSDGANFQIERDMFFEHNSLSPSPLGSKIKMQLAITTDGTNDSYIYLNPFSASLDYGTLASFIGGDSGSVGDPIGSPQEYTEGQVMVSTGRYISGSAPNTVGSGYIRLNANPKNAATPYMDIVERTGSGIYDIELKARLGDLSGVAGTRNVPADFTGFGLMSEVAFLSGSQIKLEAPAFALGDLNSNFVSGSNGNIEISSSNFHLDANGDVTLTGDVTANTGRFGGTTGWVVGSNKLTSNAGNISLDANAGDIIVGSGANIVRLSGTSDATISAGSLTPTSAPFQVSKVGAITASSALVSGSNVTLETPKFFLGQKGTQFVSGSSGNIEISSSNFHLSSSGDLRVAQSRIFDKAPVSMSSSQISASSGLIGQFGSYNDTVLSDVLAYGNNGCTHHYTFDVREGVTAGNWEDGDELLNSADTAASAEVLNCVGDDALMVSGSVLDGAVIGTAIQFNSDAYLESGTNVFDSAGNAAQMATVSVSFWVRYGTIDSTRRCIWNFSRASGNNGFSCQSFYGQLIFCVWDDDGNDSGVLTISSPSMSTSLFNHVVFTYEGGANIKAYVNGVLAGTTDISSTGDLDNIYNMHACGITIGGVGTHNARFGNAPGTLETSGFAFNGRVDDFRVYEPVLSAAQVLTLYNTVFQTLQPHGSNITLDTTAGVFEVSTPNLLISGSGDVEMQGTITATAGKIGGWSLQNGQLTGSAAAKIVTQESGRRVEIDGSDNSLTFFSGSSGVQIMELSDDLNTYVILPSTGASYKFGGIKIFGTQVGYVRTTSATVANATGFDVAYQCTMPYINTPGSNSHARHFVGYAITHPGPTGISNNTTGDSVGTYVNIDNSGTGNAYGSNIRMKQSRGGVAGQYITLQESSLNSADVNDGIGVYGVYVNNDITSSGEDVHGYYFSDTGAISGGADKYGLRVVQEGDGPGGSPSEFAYGVHLTGTNMSGYLVKYAIFEQGYDYSKFNSPVWVSGRFVNEVSPHGDDAQDLGNASYRWDDVRATNGTIQTSDRNEKTQISGSDLGLSFINDLNPVKYQWASKSRPHYGLIAQEVSESLAKHSVHTDNFAGYIKDTIYSRTEITYVSKSIAGAKEFSDNKFESSPGVENTLILTDLEISASSEHDVSDFEVYFNTPMSQSEHNIKKSPEIYGDISHWEKERETLGLRYPEFIAPLIKSVQELTHAHNNLIAQITGSTDLNQLKAAVTASLI